MKLPEILRGNGYAVERVAAPAGAGVRVSKDGHSAQIDHFEVESGAPCHFLAISSYKATAKGWEFACGLRALLAQHGAFDVPKGYRCQRLKKPIEIDGSLSDRGWKRLSWTSDFVDITGDPERKPRFRTRVKMGWDDEFFYVGAELEEPHVWGTITEKNAKMFEDNDFEVFIDPDGDGLNYYEFEINALGTIWELSLPKPYRDGGVPVSGCNLPGLKSAVQVRGTLNDPSDEDEGWSVEVAFPWAGLAQYNQGRATPPRPGDIWKVNFSRVQWRHEIVDGKYVRVPPHGTPLSESLNPEEQQHPEDNWVWSPQGEVNMHLPLRWGNVEFDR